MSSQILFTELLAGQLAFSVNSVDFLPTVNEDPHYSLKTELEVAPLTCCSGHSLEKERMSWA